MLYNETKRESWISKKRIYTYDVKRIEKHHKKIITKEQFLEVKKIFDSKNKQ